MSGTSLEVLLASERVSDSVGRVRSFDRGIGIERSLRPNPGTGSPRLLHMDALPRPSFLGVFMLKPCALYPIIKYLAAFVETQFSAS